MQVFNDELLILSMGLTVQDLLSINAVLYFTIQKNREYLREKGGQSRILPPHLTGLLKNTAPSSSTQVIFLGM